MDLNRPIPRDRPTEWLHCFGISDNPFSPTQSFAGVDLRPLQLETNELKPHRQSEIASLFSDKIDHFLDAFTEFQDVAIDLGEQGLRRGPMFLIYGPSGAGKASLVNLCRWYVCEQMGRGPLCTVDLQHPDLRRASVAQVAEAVARGLAEDQGVQPGNQSLSELLQAVRNEAQERPLALVLLRRFNSGLAIPEGSRDAWVDNYLTMIQTRLEKEVAPILFATTSEGQIARAFEERPLGAATSKRKVLTLGEASGTDVVDYVADRLQHFRDTDPPDQDGLFPFHEQTILSSFEDLQEHGMLGKLPLRIVNQILATALRRTKNDLMDAELAPYEPNGADLDKRLVPKDKLDNALGDLIGG